MKKAIFTFICIVSVAVGFSQATYYWSGGGVSTAWTTASNWNRVLGGTGLSRSTPNVGDTLIFDGSNLGAGFTGQISVINVPYQTVAAIIFRNNADVKFTNSPGTPLASGTTAAGSFIGTSPNISGQTITGSNTLFSSFFTVGDFVNTGTANTGTGGANSIGQITAIASDVSLTQSNGAIVMAATNGSSVFFLRSAMVKITNLLQVDAGSKFEMASSAPLIFKVNSSGVGTINGTVSMTTNFQKLVAYADGSAFITFNNGSKFQFTGSQSSAPFDGVANPTNNNIIFKAGSVYENNGTTSATTNSCGSVFGAVIPRSVVDFQKGSTFINNSNQISSVIGNANRAYPNVILANTTSGWQPTSPVDTFTISSNTTWTNTSNSYFPIKGDFINNGTFICGVSGSNLASPVLVFCGTVPQNITSNGSVTAGGFARIVIGSGSSVKLTTNFTQNVTASLGTNGSYIRNYGSLDFGNFVVSNAIENQTGALQGYSTATTVGTQTGAVVTAASPYTITVANNSGFSQGMLVTGTGIPIGTTVVLVSGTSPGPYTVTVSNPIPAGTYDIATSVRTGGSLFTTAHTGGLAANYPLQTGSTYSFPSAPGANYVFNAATTTPFPSTITSLQTNNLTLGAAVTSNVANLVVNGTLNLANNMLSIRSADTLRISSGNAIAGAGANSYVSIGVNKTSGAKGLVRIGNIASTTVFPIGTNGFYLPLTVTPAAAGEDFSVSVFDGATIDATPNGTPISSTQKQNIVDAVWTVNSNFTPTGNSTLQFAWPASLEGSNFAGFNNAIGISQFTTDWNIVTGVGNNTANTASGSFNTFTAFGIAQAGFTLPVKFTGLSATVTSNNTTKISWQVSSEINVDKYVVEASTDAFTYTAKGTINASSSASYSFVDVSSPQAVMYYRIKAIDKSGAVTYSSVAKVSQANVATASVQVYPNPVVNRTFSVSLSNLPKNTYRMQLVNIAGQVVFEKTMVIAENANTAAYNFVLNNSISSGLYHMRVSSETYQFTKDIIIK